MQRFLKWFAAVIVNQIKRDELGPKLYEALARLLVSTAFEAIAFRRDVNGAISIFLTQRGPDEAYAGQWHFPGSIIRVGESPRDVMNRVGTREFGSSITQFSFIDWRTRQEARGWFLQIVCAVELAQEPTKPGQWFLLSALPEPMVSFHRDEFVGLLKGYLTNLKA